MRKFILCSILALMVSSCGYEIGEKPEPPKPKLTKEQEYKQRLEDYDVGNYYLPEEREQAEEDAAKVRAIFQERLNKSK